MVSVGCGHVPFVGWSGMVKLVCLFVVLHFTALRSTVEGQKQFTPPGECPVNWVCGDFVITNAQDGAFDFERVEGTLTISSEASDHEGAPSFADVLPNLKQVGRLNYACSATKKRNIELLLPTLYKVEEDFQVNGCAALRQVSLDSLDHVGGEFYIQDSPRLARIRIPRLEVVGSLVFNNVPLDKKNLCFATAEENRDVYDCYNIDQIPFFLENVGGLWVCDSVRWRAGIPWAKDELETCVVKTFTEMNIRECPADGECLQSAAEPYTKHDYCHDIVLGFDDSEACIDQQHEPGKYCQTSEDCARKFCRSNLQDDIDHRLYGFSACPSECSKITTADEVASYTIAYQNNDNIDNRDRCFVEARNGLFSKDFRNGLISSRYDGNCRCLEL